MSVPHQMDTSSHSLTGASRMDFAAKCPMVLMTSITVAQRAMQESLN